MLFRSPLDVGIHVYTFRGFPHKSVSPLYPRSVEATYKGQKVVSITVPIEVFRWIPGGGGVWGSVFGVFRGCNGGGTGESMKMTINGGYFINI